MSGVLKDKKAFAVFLLPGLLFYLFSVFYPIVDSIRLSTMKWNGIGVPEFVGLGNYTKLFGDKVFYQAFFNNLIYLVIVVLMQLTIGFVFAVLLTYMKRGVSFVKTLYYVPCIITTVAVTQLFRNIYSAQPQGLLNGVLEAVGLGGFATSWLSNVKTALACVSIPEGWRYTGMYMVIFYAALISLDPEVCEAAKVDGANEWQTLIRIKIPMIKPILLLTLTMVMTGALRGFDIPYILTNGGPGNVTELLSTYMYKKAFGANKFGYGSAVAVFIIIESILVVAILQMLFRERDTQTGKRRSRK
ncbi:MAG: sugar ABC transporter permease [Lachnospiraceae bacterium]|nr:sugar ABC transporter permease [Lachnospiraceae bacterium]